MFADQWQQSFNQLDPAVDTYLIDALALLMVLDAQAMADKNTFRALLNRMIAAIDQQLSKQLSAVLAAPAFVELEALWRNLHALVTLPGRTDKVKVKLLDASWHEISHDLNTSVSVERSCLYNFICNRELNTLGGQPFGIFVVNHEISMEMNYEDEFDDLYSLELLARLGELCLCPFVLSISDNFFGYSGSGWLTDTRRIGKILQGPDFSGWRRLREHPAMKFIALTMPKIKLRPRYVAHRIGFIFNEVKSVEQGLWGSSAFAFASTAVTEFNRLGWFGFMKSRWQDEYQGAIINTSPNAKADYVFKHPKPDVHFIGSVARFYSEQGFIPLCHSPMTDKFFFHGNHSLWQEGKGEEDSVGSQIQSILMSCRIAHYLKVQIRNMIGSFHSASECQRYLSNWIENYSSHLVDGDEKSLSKYPLSKGQVVVKEREDGAGGRFVCELTIQPQYQFDHFCGEMMLSTDLGKLK
jgi:type VI secretion system protein ImpD